MIRVSKTGLSNGGRVVKTRPAVGRLLGSVSKGEARRLRKGLRAQGLSMLAGVPRLVCFLAVVFLLANMGTPAKADQEAAQVARGLAEDALGDMLLNSLEANDAHKDSDAQRTSALRARGGCMVQARLASGDVNVTQGDGYDTTAQAKADLADQQFGNAASWQQQALAAFNAGDWDAAVEKYNECRLSATVAKDNYSLAEDRWCSATVRYHQAQMEYEAP